MEVKILPYRLFFEHPFKIAHTTRSFTDNAYLLVSQGKFRGIGECIFIPYYRETLETLKQFISQITLPNSISDIEEVIAINIDFKEKYPDHRFAIAALDIALHNLLCKIQNTSIQQMYGIDPSLKESSFTLGISTSAEMKAKIELASEETYFKLKVTEESIHKMITNYSQFSDKPFVVDANQGFSNKEYALEWCIKLKAMGAAYLEQPFDKHDLESHRWLKDRSPIPILADESYQTIVDLDTIGTSFHGINVKLMKSGGITEAVQSLRNAREKGLKTVLGCMSESSLACQAAWQLAPLADWVDLDGPKLIKNDPFSPELKLTDSEIIRGLQQP